MAKNEVRYELQTALASLFQPVADKLEGHRPKKTVRREHSGGWIEFNCFEELSTFDETVALAILRIASEPQRSSFLGDSPNTDLGKEMRALLDPKKNLTGHKIGLVRESSLYELAKLMGYKRPGAAVFRNIRASLKRLSMVLVSERNDLAGSETHGESGFIHHKVLDSGKLSIVITRRLAMAAFGEKGWKYALLNLGERNALRGDIAKSAHKFLVSWFWRVGIRSVRIDTIAESIWKDWNKYKATGRSTLRQRLKSAICQIGNLPNWKIEIKGRGAKAQASIVRGKEVEAQPTVG